LLTSPRADEMTSIVDAESLLTIDIGAVNTRALLFDVVDGQYHFLAAGSAPSTHGSPFFDVAEGVHIAISRLQQITDRPLLNPENNRILIPTQTDGSGVDRLAVTYSAGPELHLVAMGLLNDVSLDSAQRLAATTYGRLVEKIGLNDQRKQEEQLDALLACGPHIILLAGGTERGATRSVGKLVELVLLACKNMDKDIRPRVLYCGNQALAKRIQSALSKVTEIEVAPNIRPTIDLEDISPAADTLGKMVASLRAQQLGGLSNLASICSVPVIPNAIAMGRLMRFLSQLYDPGKGVLGVDLGGTSTTFAAATAGSLALNVTQPLGMGSGLVGLLQQCEITEITRWLAVDVPDAEVRDYLWQKTLFPAMLPMTNTTLAIEQAAARQILQLAAMQMHERYPGVGMNFEPIFAGGSILSGSPSPMQSLMVLLDGLQPTGVTSVFLDPYGLMAGLGAIAPANTTLPVQILESGAFTNLAWVISPVSDARPGTVILHLRLEYEDGSEQILEVRQGSIVPLPVRHGQMVKVFLKDAAYGVHVDSRLSRGGLKIYGGVCGAFADARGRPLVLPTDAVKRRETLLRWSQAFETRRAA
jgi:hypothetical protein